MQRTSSSIAILCAVVLSLVGCKSHEGHGHEHDGETSSASHGESSNGHEGHAQPEPESGDADHAQDSHGSGLQLTLNEGEKWPVDGSTRESAARLASLVAGTESMGTIEDARVLGKALDEELDTLVKGCKMTGPAHDQLHVFLLALFPQVEALKEKAEIADLQQAHQKVGELLEAYSLHFES